MFDAFAANPLVDEARTAHPEAAGLATRIARPPSLFAAGDLPEHTRSGIDKQKLLEIPWQARHTVAAEPDPGRAWRLVTEYADDEQGMAASYDFAGHPANERYESAVESWLAAGAAVGTTEQWDTISQLLDDGLSVQQVMRATGATEEQVRHVKQGRDEDTTAPARPREVWKTGW